VIPAYPGGVPPSVDIRIAVPADRGAIIDLIRDAWDGRVDARSSGHRFSVDDLDHLIDTEGALTWVAVRGLDIVGTVTVIPRSSSGLAEVTKLAVRAPLRGGDISNELMNRVPFDSLLAVSLFQPDLVRFYARMGYVVDVEAVYSHASPLSPKPIVMTRPGPTDDVIVEGAVVLDAGGTVGLPTETVYGLAADASNALAVRRVFGKKGRPVDHPLIVHLAAGRHLDQWAMATDEARLLAATLWPGPLTLVLPRQSHVLDEVTGGRDTVAVRVPRHGAALALIAMLGEGAGVVAPSANRFGGVSPTRADHVRADGLADFVIDGGPCEVGVESTILELVDGRAQILRPGAISAAQIEAVIGRRVETEVTGESRAPGMLASHYAPRAAVHMMSPGDAVPTGWSSVGYLGPADTAPPGVTVLPTVTPYTSHTVAQVLYARLRDADTLGLDLLLVVAPPDGDLGPAVRDRLTRAAAPRPS
jgi:L-threonylcarbamoyladenylate synthase